MYKEGKMVLSGKWKSLQNGSDIRGVALDTNPEEKVNLTEYESRMILEGFIAWLDTQKSQLLSPYKIAVGVDSRISGPALKQAALETIKSKGHLALDCGIASTPAMFMSCIYPETACDGAIMITASHLPSNRNGLKFFTAEGGLEKQDISFILTKAQELSEGSNASSKEASASKDASNSKEDSASKETSSLKEASTSSKASELKSNSPSSTVGRIENLDLISIYAKDLADKIRVGVNSSENYERPLEGMKIVVDAGNGAGGFFADKILEVLGADTTGSQFLEPDGLFPNHIPNPEDKEAMDSITRAVIDNKADLGLIFDTDVDRAAAVDKLGRAINRNRIIALMAAIVLEEHPGTTIVTDSITSSELKKFIEKDLKGRHHRFKRGYKNVINESIRLNSIGEESHLAIETSGHGALKENYFMDDGAYLTAKILIRAARLKKEGKTIDMLIEAMEDPLEAKEFRLGLGADDFLAYGQTVLEELSVFAEQENDWHIEEPNYEGIRVSFDKGHGDGWFLLRMSLHDPIMPLNIESNSPGGVRTIAGALMGFLAKYPDLETRAIREYMG